jgi:hypothetical protein
MKQRGGPGSFSNAAGMFEATTRDGELHKRVLVDISRFQPIDG